MAKGKAKKTAKVKAKARRFRGRPAKKAAAPRPAAPAPRRQVAVPTPKTALPPSNGEPAAQRAGDILAFPGGNAPGRARMATGLQETVGNARMGRMVAESRPSTEAETPAAEAAPATEALPETEAAAPAEAAPAPQAAKGPLATLLGKAREMAGRLGLGFGKAEGKAEEKKGEEEKGPAGPKEGPAAEAPAEAAPAPAAEAPAPAAPVAGAAPAPAPAAAEGTGAAGAARGFLSSTATQMAAGYAGFGDQVTAGFAEDRQQAQADAPPLVAEAGQADTAAMPDAAKAPPSQARTAPRAAPPKGPPERQRPAGSSEVRTDAGPAPRFEATGEADPEQAAAAEQGAAAEAEGAYHSVAAEISANPGESRIEPVPVTEQRELVVPEAKAALKTEPIPEMEEYLAMPFEGGVREAVDQAMAPNLEASLSGARDQIAEAEAQRDADYTAAVDEAQAEAAALSEKADQEQTEAVRQARADVHEEKEKGLAEGRAEVDAANADLSQKRREQEDEINRKIEKEEKRADDELAKAEQKAEEERKKAEEEKRKKEEEARRKEKNKSFWDKVGDFFTDLWNAVKEAVTKIFDAVKKVVKGLIDAAQKLVTSIIDGLRDFVVGAIKAFGELAKTMVTTLVGSVFPELAEKINAAIDTVVGAAVEVVNAIADKLKEGINELFDQLNAIVDAVLNAFETLMEGVFAMVDALLAGDFAAFAKIAFMTACKLVGIDGEALLKILEKAGSLFLEVIKHPASFVKNLIQAVMKGFNQFMDNFGKHIMTALMGWLFGQVAATGIKLPSSFSVAGIFDVVRQVLGLTYEYVRGRAVSILGEDKVELIEKVAGYVKRLFTEGPEALWKEFKQYLSDLKEKIIGQAAEWLITQVVKAAIIKLTSMLIPGGGFVQAILAIYDTVMFFVQKIKEIMEVVSSILDSVQKIAAGSIGAAANFIEQTIVKTMPLVMDFLARLLKIGNIGAQIRKIIDMLRTPVDMAVDFVVKGAVMLVGKAWSTMKEGAAHVKDRLTGKKKDEAAKEVSSRDLDNMSPEERVSAARDYVAAKLTKPMTGQEIYALLPKVQAEYRLKQIAIDRSKPETPTLEFRVNPVVNLPLKPTAMKPMQAQNAPGKPQLLRKAAESAETPYAAIGRQIGGASPVKDRFWNTKSTFARPGKVEAIVVGPRRTGPRADAPITAEVGHLGDDETFLLTTDATGKRYAGGHLIGDQLMPAGGPDTFVDWNLAPQASTLNNPAYLHAVEFPIAIGPTDGKKTDINIPITVQVTLEYPDDTYEVPESHLLSLGALSSGALPPAKKAKPSPAATQPATPTAANSVKIASRIPRKWSLTATTLPGWKFPQKEIKGGTKAAEMHGPVLGATDLASWTVVGSSVDASGTVTIPGTDKLQFEGRQSVPSRNIQNVTTAPTSPGPSGPRQDPAAGGSYKPKFGKGYNSYNGASISLLTQAEIEAVVGIGPGLAPRIYSHLQTVGKLNSLNDLKIVSGVGDATIEKLTDAGLVA